MESVLCAREKNESCATIQTQQCRLKDLALEWTSYHL